MSSGRIFGFILLAIGVTLLIFGLNASDSPADKLSDAVTGKYTDETMWYIVGGIAAAVAGGALVVFGGGRTVKA
jgi:uncharacterized protein DUF3185